jgi:hypothetical protein
MEQGHSETVLGDNKMKATQTKSVMQGLLIVFVVGGTVLLLRNTFTSPSPEGPETEHQEGTEPALSQTDPDQAPTQDPKTGPKDPLYFRMVFGAEGVNSMLGKLERSGADTGYDLAYVDENNNGDLTDDAAKTLPRYERGSRSGQLDPRFDFNGPFKNGETAKYTLNIYELTRKNRADTGAGDYYYFWYLNTEQWHYFFINGKMRLSASMAEAQEGPPVRLGGPCKWEITSTRREGQAMVSAGVKDENGCTLRVLSQSGEDLAPRLSLIKDGKVAAEQAMEFG